MPTILAVLQIFCQKVFHRVGNKVAKVWSGDLLLGRLGLPDRLPFSKPKVNWLLHRSPHRVQQVAL